MKKIFLPFFCIIPGLCMSQKNRIADYNNINWAQVFVSKSIGKKTSLLVEYQLRRTDGLKNGQQGLFRTAFQYNASDAASFAIGYAEAETFSYGSFPVAVNGRFPEHRLFEQVILKQKMQKLAVQNRFRIEQRWLGVVKPGTKREIEKWSYSNRFRYLLRLQYPFGKKFYGWVGEELFISAGKNIGSNIFDQNRLHVCIGFNFNEALGFDIGYLNQVVQQGKLVSGSAVFQYNNGITVSCNVRF